MAAPEGSRDQVPDVCENCREALRIVAVKFRLLRARALLACPHCGRTYAEPERRAKQPTAV